MKPEPAARPRGQVWEGTIRVASDEPGKGKVFRGAWLEAPDGQRRVLTYEGESPFHALRDQAVRVEGEIYQPEGQALLAEHLRSHGLWVVDSQASLTQTFEYIGEKHTLRGHFEERQVPAGAKLAGESFMHFEATGGESYLLSHVPKVTVTGPRFDCSQAEPQTNVAMPPCNQEISVEAYRVEPSRYIQRMGGPYLWVASWKPASTNEPSQQGPR